MAKRNPLIEEALTYSIIGGFYDVRREMGFGYREVIYSLALEAALTEKGHKVAREVPVMVYFRGRPLARQVMDMVVDDTAIIEIKSPTGSERDACRQLYSYLWGTKYEVGLVLQFARKPKFYRLVCEN